MNARPRHRLDGEPIHLKEFDPTDYLPDTEEKIQLQRLEAMFQARENFFDFRRFMDPEMLLGWWVKEVSEQLQVFYLRMLNGERPKLIIEAPPQHGKSRGLTDFVAWLAGKCPMWRVIYASFSEDLGLRANTMMQRTLDDPRYSMVFPETRLNSTNSVTVAARYARNSTLLEYVAQKGSFINVTVQGAVNGKSLDLGIIDDPMKGREEAQSKTIRDKTWNWLTDDFFSRFSEYAGLILTTTRWHVDDPAGRWLKEFPDTVVLRYPAEWTPEARVVQKKPLVMNSARDIRTVVGEPLFPQFKSKEFLKLRRKLYTEASWESLYQQSPIIAGGGMFPMARKRIVAFRPSANDIVKTIRYWDKAGTEGGGAWSAGVRMHRLIDGRCVVSNVVRGQWGAYEREQMILATCENDDQEFDLTETYVEQEPGSGGKESAERTVNMLAGHIAHIDRVTGSKETRAEPYAAQWQAGNILLVQGDWNDAFTEEHETFPNGKYKDQVDAAAAAFMKLVTSKYDYDDTMEWAAN